MKRIFFFFFFSWRYEKKNLITLYETAKRAVSYKSVIRFFFFFFSYLHETKKKKKISSFLIISYNRQYTPTEIIQTAFIFCIFNIMLEFPKPLPLIFRSIYYHFAEFSTSSFDDVTVDDVTVNRDMFTKGWRPGLFFIA